MIAILFSTGVFAQGIIGEENLKFWTGEYVVVSCESCSDIRVSDGFSLSDIKIFYIGTYTVQDSELPECAQTNNDIYFDYVLESQAGTLYTSFFSERGLCYWGENEEKSLVMTKKTFEYKLTKSSRKLLTRITKIKENLYEVFQSISEGSRMFEFKAVLGKNLF